MEGLGNAMVLTFVVFLLALEVFLWKGIIFIVLINSISYREILKNKASEIAHLSPQIILIHVAGTNLGLDSSSENPFHGPIVNWVLLVGLQIVI